MNSKKNFTVRTTLRPAQLRSASLRKYSVAATASTVSSDGIASSGDSHTHSNKLALDALSLDESDYLYATQRRDGEEVATTAKIKSGHSDNATLWDNHTFAQYIDQPLRTTDSVAFGSVEANGLSFWGAENKGFVSGLQGVGARIDEAGNAELHSLMVRLGITTPVLTLNDVQVSNGEQWFTDGGIVNSYTDSLPLSDADGTILTDADGTILTAEGAMFMDFVDANNEPLRPFRVGDILRAVWRADNQVEFKTLFYEVTAQVGDGYEVQGLDGTTTAPEVGMTMVRQGNRTDTTRQGCTYIGKSATGQWFVRTIQGVTGPQISIENISAQQGYVGDVTNGLVEFGLYAPGLDAEVIASQIQIQKNITINNQADYEEYFGGGDGYLRPDRSTSFNLTINYWPSAVIYAIFPNDAAMIGAEINLLINTDVSNAGFGNIRNSDLSSPSDRKYLAAKANQLYKFQGVNPLESETFEVDWYRTL